MQNNPMKSKISRLRDSVGRCLWWLVRLRLMQKPAALPFAPAWDANASQRSAWCRAHGLGPEWTIVQHHEIPHELRTRTFDYYVLPNNAIRHERSELPA